MKKTFTFLATIVLLTTVVFAQNNGNHQRDNKYDNNNYGRNNHSNIVLNDNPTNVEYNDREGRGYYFSEREKNMQISKINNEYFYRIQTVKNKFFMGRHQKDRIITALQFQRDGEIRSVLKRYIERGNRFDRKYDRHDDHDRRN